MAQPHKILVINGSLGGDGGNTAQVLSQLVLHLSPSSSVEVVHLSESPEAQSHDARLRSADGFVFATGTYWDSWGSPLQRFLESATDFEASDIWMGKPAASLVTMHSVGGKGVLSRLQGVLSTLGVLVPPMSGMTYSLANHIAMSAEIPPALSEFRSDLWQLGDLKVISANLLAALEMRKGRSASWTPWPIDSGDPYRRWL